MGNNSGELATELFARLTMNMNLRTRYLAAIALSLTATVPAWATWKETSACPFCTTFDTGTSGGLSNTGSGGPPPTATWNNDQIVGWFIQETGTATFNPSATYAISNGTLPTTSSIVSYGSNGSTDRALGAISGTDGTNLGAVGFGLLLHNNSGATINTVYVQYKGEQWRNGGGAGPQSISFSYGISAGTASTSFLSGTTVELQLGTPGTGGGTSVASGFGANATWFTGPGGSTFTAPINGGTAGALDGNAAANSSTQTFALTGLNLTANQYLMLRWIDANDSGAPDHGLAIDDVCVQLTAFPVPEPSTYAAGAAVLAMVGGAAWRRRKTAAKAPVAQA